MRKEFKIIICLVVLIVLLCGGILFVVKTDVFSSRKDNIVEKDDKSDEEVLEKETSDGEEKQDVESNKSEEVVDSPEEVKPEDKTSASNGKPSNENKPSEDKTNNDKLSNTGGNDTKHENTPVTPPKEDKPVVVDPTIPIENDTMTALVCSIELINEDNIPTKQIVTIDFYDSTKLPYSIIMTTYMNLASFGYTDSQIKELLNEIKGSAESIPGFQFGTWQTGDTIELSYSSSATSLRKYYPNEYKIGGEMSYDVTKRDFINQGYTCN